ncbi:hypothetical protein [Thalassotalea profundi]|uniref:Uncharacterized protein n=1 Tax=Thalassotalea profundi TaxID=2036687 RepID=A0ABQ3IF78_9GAMM|nr:hypothetical protein [Thalassotalea profundi]GHE78858.1 hypothetical protein GCM10011501_03430 [Thalassotalea profundi]
MMTLFSWYLSERQEKTYNQLTEKASHIEGMWPIAKVRQNTQLQHQEYISHKRANLASHHTKNEGLLP